MKYLPLLFLFAVLGFGLVATSDAPVEADEPQGSLLDALSKEAAATVAKADDAQVSVLSGGSWYRAVLVGVPPRIVSPYVGEPKDLAVKVRLADGTERAGRVVDGDSELGVSVIEVPAEKLGARQGLTLVGRGAAKRGALGVLAGNAPSLALINRVDEAGGRFHSDVRDDAAVLLAAGGKLLGLRSVMGPKLNCADCHTNGGSNVGFWNSTANAAHHWYTTAKDAHGRYTLRVQGWPLAVGGNGKPTPHTYAGKNFHRRLADGTVAGVHHPWVTGRNPAAHAKDYVSADVIRRVLEDINQHGKIQRAYLGIVPGQVDAKSGGVRLRSVLGTSPAEKAGLKAGDVVTKLDDVACTSPARLTLTLAHKRPGERVTLTIKGKTAVTAKLEDRASIAGTLVTAAGLGLTVRDLDDSLREWLGVSAEVEGVIVMAATGPIVRQTGIRRGDVITQLDGKPVRDVEELDTNLALADKSARIRVLRSGKTIELRIPSLDLGAAPGQAPR